MICSLAPNTGSPAHVEGIVVSFSFPGKYPQNAVKYTTVLPLIAFVTESL
jgi:hypothetical protein